MESLIFAAPPHQKGTHASFRPAGMEWSKLHCSGKVVPIYRRARRAVRRRATRSSDCGHSRDTAGVHRLTRPSSRIELNWRGDISRIWRRKELSFIGRT